jgi:hypothetical protein
MKGLPIRVAAAHSPSLSGEIIAIGERIQVIDAVCPRTFIASEMIEVALANRKHGRPGDSGTLACVQVDGQLIPLGIVEGGALAARLHDRDSVLTGSLILTPLRHILDAWTVAKSSALELA